MEPTEQQLKNREDALNTVVAPAPVASATPTISVDALQSPQKPLQLPQEQYQAPQVPDLSTLIADAQKQLASSSEQQTREAQLLQQQDVYATLLGQQPTKTELEAGARNQFGVGNLEKEVAEISGQLGILSAEGNQLSAERSQIMDVLREEARQQGRSVFAGGFAPEVASRTRALDFKIRTNAIEQMGIGAQYLAKQGQLTAAQNLTNRAVDLQFEEQERNVASAKARIDALQGAVERGDVQLTKVQNVALAERNRLLDNQQKEIEAEKEMQKEIRGYAVEAGARNAPADVLRAITESKSPEAALIAAAEYLYDPKNLTESTTSPVNVGVGASSLVEEQIIRTRLFAKLSTILNKGTLSDADREIIEGRISQFRDAGLSEQEIMSRIAGFAEDVDTPYNIPFIEAASVVTDTPEAQNQLMAQLGILLGNGNAEAAMQKIETVGMEKAKKQQGSEFVSEADAQYVAKKVDEINNLLGEDWVNGVGLVEGMTLSRWIQGKFGFGESVKIRAKLTNLTAELINKRAGSALTDSEWERLVAGSVPALNEASTTARTKLNELTDDTLSRLNAERSMVALPEVNKEQLLDKNARLKLYERADTVRAKNDDTRSRVIEYGRKNPEAQEKIDTFLQENPNATFDDIQQIFNIPMSLNTVPKVALETIKKEEGFRSQAYQDQTGKWTIGYGTTMINGVPVKKGDTISEPKALSLLSNQVRDTYSNWASMITRPLTDSQKAALYSFEYNLGGGIWDKSAQNIINSINSGDFATASKEMQKYDKAKVNGNYKVLPVLAARRKREAQLLLS